MLCCLYLAYMTVGVGDSEWPSFIFLLWKMIVLHLSPPPPTVSPHAFHHGQHSASRCHSGSDL